MSAVLDDATLHDLSDACALDLSMYRRSHVEARIDRALQLEHVSAVSELRRLIQRSDEARTAFRRSVAISVTDYFRDAEQFSLLERLMRAASSRRRPVRAWSAGCATGEETWSIAAVLQRAGCADGATVLGSDVLPENIRVARQRRPGAGELGGTVVPRSVRVRFEVRDLVHQGCSGTGWDLVLCRNVAIYLAADHRRALHRALAGAVRRGGLLMLGRSERLMDPGALGLERVEPHCYRRVA